MIEFASDNLKSRVLEMIERFSFVDGDIEEIPFSDIVDECAECEAMITEDSVVCLYIGEDNFPKTSLSYLLALSKSWNTTKINQSQSYAKSSTEVDFLLNVSDYNTVILLEGLDNVSVNSNSV